MIDEQGGFYYSAHGKKIHAYGFPNKDQIEAEVAALQDSNLVVDWNDFHFDGVGNVHWDVHEATPEELGN